MSFRLKTILGIAVIELTVMAILITVNQFNLGGAASSQLFERVESTGQLFATMVADAVISYDLATLDAMVANALHNDDLVYLRVVSAGGIELAAGGAQEVLAAPFVPDPNFETALTDSRIDTSSPIAIAGENFGSIQIGISTLPVEQDMASALRWNMFVAGLGMTLVAVFGYLLGSILTRQLSTLRTGAEMITQGDLGFQIVVKGQDELAQTAHCFNNMARTLAEDRKALEVKQSELLEKRDHTLEIVESMKRIAAGSTDSVVVETEREDEIGDMARATVVFQNAMHEVLAKREEQARLLYAFDQLDEQVAIFSEDGSCMFLNAAFRNFNAGIIDNLPSGFSYEEFLNEGLAQQVFLGAMGREADWLNDRLCSLEATQGASEIAVAPDRTLLLRRTSVEGIGMVVSAADVSELKTSQAQLVQASKLATLGEMATGIAHELNQPLGVIRMAAANCAKRIAKGQVDPNYLTGKLERISEQTVRASQIIDHMRIFGRSDDGRRDDFDLSASLTNACHLMHKQLELDGIKLTTNFPDQGPPVSGQQVMFEQVILNLLSNAKDAILANDNKDTQAGVEVSLVADDYSAKGCAIVRVQDNGGGFPPPVLNRLFDPFFTTKEPGKGTGLGLSISYGIVRDMGGKISARNLDSGACFEIVMPIGQAVAAE